MLCAQPASIPSQCAQCLERCADVLKLVNADVLGVATEIFTDVQASTKSTVSGTVPLPIITVQCAPVRAPVLRLY